MILDIISECVLLPLIIITIVDVLLLWIIQDKKIIRDQLYKGRFLEPTIKLTFDILVLLVLVIINTAVFTNLYYDIYASLI